MRTRFYVGVLVCLATGCTSLLGSFEVDPKAGGVGPGDGDGGGTGETGGPTGDAATDAVNDVSSSDAPIDAPHCAAPTVPCGGTCVDLDSDDKNCAACGKGCLGGKCSMRRCEPGLFVARMDIDDRVFAASEMNLFFATTTFEVVQTPLSGAAPVSLGKAAGKVHAIAPAGAMKVFFTAENANGTTWDMWSAAVGTMGSATARGFQVGGTPVGLIAAGGNLFTQQVLPGGAESFNLTYCAQSGGGFSGIAGGTRPGRKLAAGSSYVFWTDQFGAVFAMPDAVGTRTTVAGAEGTADSPSWDGAMLYWVNNASGLLRRSAYPNNGASTFQDITFGANDLVVDATNVYYSQYDGIAKNFLYVIPKSAPLGTAPTVVATGEIRRLVQNPFAVFWVEPDGVHAYRKP